MDQKPTNLKDVAELFPPEMRNSPHILIAGGAAVDLQTCADVDVFIFGPKALMLWKQWMTHLLLHDLGDIQCIYPPDNYYDAPMEGGAFQDAVTERYNITLDGWGDEIDVIIRHGYHCTGARELLNSFDIVQCQVGYRLNGECVTGDEFDPDAPAIRLSSAGKRAIDQARGITQSRLREKSKKRLDKYARKLGLPVDVDSYYYGPGYKGVESMPKIKFIDSFGEEIPF